MEAEQEMQEDRQYLEEAYPAEEETYPEEGEVRVPLEQSAEPEEYLVAEEATEQQQEPEKKSLLPNLVTVNQSEDRSNFVHGLSVGLGIGCISTFVIMWITVFFSPQLPSTITYEAMLSIFIYPLIYLITVGSIALTAGIVKEYYTRKRNF